MDIYKLNFTHLEQEIISFLCIYAGNSFSQRDIAKQLNVSPTAVSNSLIKLIDKKIVTLTKTKTINFISFNRDASFSIGIKRVENLKNIYSSKLIEYLEETLAGATLILFGSYALGEDNIDSDIDIAVIGRKDKLLNLQKYEKVLHRVINVNFYTSWKEIHKNLKNNILNGIVLSGSVDL